MKWLKREVLVDLSDPWRSLSVGTNGRHYLHTFQSKMEAFGMDRFSKSSKKLREIVSLLNKLPRVRHSEKHPQERYSTVLSNHERWSWKQDMGHEILH